MKRYEAIKRAMGQVPAEITVEPYLTPGYEDDPMGVFKVEPAHTQLTKLYDELDPERDDDFQEKVHGANRAYAQLIQHHFLHFENLLYMLETIREYMKTREMEVVSRSIDGEAFLDELRKVLKAAKRVKE